MAWISPHTFAPNELVDAALLNAHIRDNLLETEAAKVTTAGDIFQASAANTIARLAAVALRSPRTNAAGNAIEYVAGVTLSQIPVYVRQTTPQNMGVDPNYATVLTQSFTSKGGLIVLIWSCQTLESKSGGSSFDHRARVTRGGAAIGDTLIYATYTGVAASYGPNFFTVFTETPGVGTYTYAVESKYVSGSTTGTPTARGQLLIVELAP